jgi:uncharacterized membrane protein YeaQ/YmgE (transglycosylase-associated protein family)
VAVLTWIMISLAIWHFTVFVPDKFVGGIIGAFAASMVGAIIGGFILSGFSMPSRDETDLVTMLLGVPGTLIALAIQYVVGARIEERAEAEAAAAVAATPRV